MKKLFLVLWYFIGCLCALPGLAFIFVSGYLGLKWEMNENKKS